MFFVPCRTVGRNRTVSEPATLYLDSLRSSARVQPEQNVQKDILGIARALAFLHRSAELLRSCE